MAATPNFFVPGATRSGTTSLYEYLRQHPQVCMGTAKEPGFFDGRSDLDFESYRRLYRPAPGEVAVGDATPTYLTSASAAAEIARRVPKARFVVMLRSPVERALSHYSFRLLTGQEHRSLGEALRQRSPRPYFLRHSAYGTQLARLLDHFDRSVVHVTWFRDLVDQPGREVLRIQRFLGLQPVTVDVSRRHNVTASRGSRLVFRLTRNRALRRVVRLLPPSLSRTGRAAVRHLHGLGRSRPSRLGVRPKDIATLHRLLAPEIDRLGEIWGMVPAAWRDPARDGGPVQDNRPAPRMPAAS